MARAADAEFAPVSPERIADLNEQAAVFYQAAYRGSWAQTYLTERLGGIDLTGEPHSRAGYAPKAWTALTDHLRRHGATDEELLAAGLARQASTGRLIDTFRDRLMLPIHGTTRRPADESGQAVRRCRWWGSWAAATPATTPSSRAPTRPPRPARST